MSKKPRFSACRLLAGIVLFASVGSAQPAHRHFAVVVGADSPIPGGAPLRYAQADARALAAVLTETGAFDSSNVAVLLDPRPAEVLAALDRALGMAAAAGPDSVLLFYYSGHADQGSLFPSGQALGLSDLRVRLADRRATTRVGLIDACRGGGWTGSKGLSAAEPFEVDVPTALASEGSVLIASSSGLESAHESEALQGSFFTHYWNAALRGAADLNQDGRVTVHEAFEYARDLTVRDTALFADVPQHPSFRMDLLGRDDLVLATLDRPRATLTIDQVWGPIQLVHLGTGVVVAESRPGARQVRLALQPGPYLVRRRREGGRTVARIIEVASASAITMREGDLSPVEDGHFEEKSVDGYVDSWRVPPGRWETQLALGVRHAPVIDPGVRVTGGGDAQLAALLRLAHGFGGLHVALPLAVALDLGDDRASYTPWAGVPVLAISSQAPQGLTWQGVVGAGFDLRLGTGFGQSVNASVSALGSWQWTDAAVSACSSSPSPCQPPLPSRQPPDSWSVQANLGYSYSIGSAVTFNLGAGAGVDLLFAGHIPTGNWDAPHRGLVVSVGSIQRRGLFGLPLVQVRLSKTLSADAYVAVSYVAPEHGVEDTYLGGVTWIW
jgi:hypothetical protein